MCKEQLCSSTASEEAPRIQAQTQPRLACKGLLAAHRFELKISNNATSAPALWAEGPSQDEAGPGSSWAAAPLATLVW